MNGPREPLHQPPNPEDLRRAPPAGPDCARVRGWLRDYVDGDLESFHVRELEEHVHRCRACGVELARAEHEVLRVRQVFRSMRVGQPVLPPDFAQRVVERLVVDETSLVSAEALGSAVRAHAAAGENAAPAPATAQRPRRFGLRPGVALLAALAMLLAVGVGLELMRGPGRGPDHSARLFLLKADGAYHEHNRLAEGDWLGDRQALSVRLGGSARFQWHDPSRREQPAAMLQLRGNGEVRLERGAPLLVDGTLDVESRREVSIPLSDGSRIDLGIGTYTIAAVSGFDPQNPLHAAPDDLFVTVEVHSGQDASITRAGFSPAIVAAGHLGSYQGSSDTNVTASGGMGNVAGGEANDRAHTPGNAPTPYLLHGQVREHLGLPVPDAGVLFTYRSGSAAVPVLRNTGPDGGILCEFASPVDSSFVVAQVEPPRHRADLGMFVPDAVPLVRHGSNATIQAPLILAPSIPFVGSVRDDLGMPLPGVRVLPCVVDEVFGAVLPLFDLQDISDGAGAFRLERLPGQLPAQQALYLVLSHDDHAGTVVPIPPRAGSVAEIAFPPVTMEQLRLVRVHGLAPQQVVHLVEELPWLPRGAALRRSVRMADATGTIPWVHVGPGTLWLNEPGSGTVRMLVPDGWTGIQQYRPSANPPEPWALRFRGVIALPGSDLEIVMSWRHMAAFPAGANGAPNRTVSLLDIAGNPVGGAQAFVCDGLTPAAMAAARFVGFTEPNGMLRWGDIGGSFLVLIAADGRVATEALAQSVGGNLAVEMPACGRVVLGPARHPAPSASQVVTLRFEPVESDPELRGPTVVRFATAATNWAVGDLVPGEYRVVIGNAAIPITVPAGGYATLP